MQNCWLCKDFAIPNSHMYEKLYLCTCISAILVWFKLQIFAWIDLNCALVYIYNVLCSIHWLDNRSAYVGNYHRMVVSKVRNYQNICISCQNFCKDMQPCHFVKFIVYFRNFHILHLSTRRMNHWILRKCSIDIMTSVKVQMIVTYFRLNSLKENFLKL